MFEDFRTDIPSPKMAEIWLDQRQQLLNGICLLEKVFTHLAFCGDLVQRGLHTLGGEAITVGGAEDAVAGGIGVDDELGLASGRPVTGDLANVRPVWLLWQAGGRLT